jgi:hypothetical protein
MPFIDPTEVPLFPSSVCIFVVQANGLSSPVRDSWESTMSSSLVKKVSIFGTMMTIIEIESIQNFLAFNTFIQWPEK